MLPVRRPGDAPGTSENTIPGDDNAGASARATYPSHGGLFADAAVKLLQDFYIRGNPKAPKPHRPLAPESAARRDAGDGPA